MKKITSYIYPMFIVILYCLILIAGEETAGFYIKYLVMGLFHGTAAGILGIGGILAIYVGILFPLKIWKPLFYLLGGIFMSLSITLFFLLDTDKYNYSTFHQPLSLSILIIFGLFIITFIVHSIVALYKGYQPKTS